MDNDEFYDTAEFLHAMVRSSLYNLENNLKNKEGKGTPEGYLKNLKGNSYYLSKISDLRERKRPKFGVFGPRNRGKSSMLNALIGADILPVSTLPMTRAAVKIHHDEKCKQDTWEVTVEFPDRRIERTEKMVKPDQVKEKIEQYGTSKTEGFLAENIEVRSNFKNCEILNKGGILVDTPGAEASIGKEDPENQKAEPANAPKEKHSENIDNTDADNSADEIDPTLKPDTERALEILKTVDVVIFCARGDYMGSKDERTFYNRYLSELRPLIVVNWKDKWEGSGKDPVAEIIKLYGFPWDRTLSFSAIQARDKDPEVINKSGLADLQKKILSEIEYISSHKGIEDCFKEYERNILNYLRLETNELIMPFRIHVMNFYHCLEGIEEEWSKNFAAQLKASELWSSMIK